MNCKPGDLAVIVASAYGNSGRIVEVLRFDLQKDKWWVRVCGSPAKNKGGGLAYEGLCPDSRLRPIRDQDGPDETLTWAGKPSEVTE